MGRHLPRYDKFSNRSIYWTLFNLYRFGIMWNNIKIFLNYYNPEIKALKGNNFLQRFYFIFLQFLLLFDKVITNSDISKSHLGKSPNIPMFEQKLYREWCLCLFFFNFICHSLTIYDRMEERNDLYNWISGLSNSK